MSTSKKPHLVPQPLGLQGFLTFRLSRLNQALNSQVTEVLAHHAQIGLSEWRVLSVIASGDAKTARDVTTLTGLDPAMISRALKQLEERGLVCSLRDTTDRRARLVSLTKEGISLFDSVLPIMRKRQEALLGSLAPHEQEQVFGIIDKLMTASRLRDF